MSKETSKKRAEGASQDLPKNPQEYSYRGDETVEMPSNVFLLIYRALDRALQKGTTISYPTVTEWVNTSTGMQIGNPNEKDIKAGKVRQIMSVEKTFDPSNALESFAEWLVPEVIQAKDMLIAVHNESVQKGNAVKISELQRERQAQADTHLKDIEVDETPK